MTPKEKGIKQAIDHANQVHPDWSELAYNKALLALLHLRTTYDKKYFSIEDVREVIRICLLPIPEPPTKRAWGSVTLRLIREKKIEKVGYAPTKSRTAHNAIAAIYKVL